MLFSDLTLSLVKVDHPHPHVNRWVEENLPAFSSLEGEGE
jgi:hypothetical protein